MNYLAHAYLSFRQPEILLGNFISDFVKGKKKFDYPPGVQQGFLLHRKIDAFTDNHPVNKEAKAVFHPYYRLYSGAFLDMTYDHFLANDPTVFPDSDALLNFAGSTYQSLESFLSICPDNFQALFPYMKTDNWLYNYQFTQGIKKGYQGLVRKAAFLTESEPAVTVLKEHYYFLEDAYKRFFPELQQFTLQHFPDRSSYNP